jgi:hypothetical protein
MRKYKSRRRESLIEQRNENSLTHLLNNKELTIAQKRALVAERNPFIYALGIGGHRVSNKAIPQTRQA